MTENKDNLRFWNEIKQVPAQFVKPIQAGRMRGMSNISPQWRLQAMTHQFGICGIGWKYTIDNKWIESIEDGQKAAFVDISLYVKVDGEWSDAIPGHGGSMFVAKEKAGLYVSDEAYKMAITDALSVAMKSLGMASDIYMGNFDGSKYSLDTTQATKPPVEYITESQCADLKSMLDEKQINYPDFLRYFKIEKLEFFPVNRYDEAVKMIELRNQKIDNENKE